MTAFNSLRALTPVFAFVIHTGMYYGLRIFNFISEVRSEDGLKVFPFN